MGQGEVQTRRESGCVRDRCQAQEEGTRMGAKGADRREDPRARCEEAGREVILPSPFNESIVQYPHLHDHNRTHIH